MISKLKEKYLTKETVSYLIFGVLTTLVNYFVFVILNLLGVGLVLNNFLAWVIAVIFAFVTNKFFVFKSNNTHFKKVLSEFISFVTARILSLLFETLFLLVAVRIFQMNEYVAKIIASVFVVIINYFFSKFYIFKDKNDSDKNLIERLGLFENDGHSSLLSGNITYVLAFILPFIVLLIVYIGRKIYPWGDECYLRSDMYHQYAPFYSELWHKLTHGESLTYSWNVGMGTNFTALSAYYLASPINWVIALFPQKSMIEIMNVLIVLKMSFSSVTFNYYVSKHYKNKSIIGACLGTFYALSGYLAAYSWNIMWLDCILLFPLIVLGIERLVKEDKYLLYTITLSLCILSNYYISIMVCLACILIFVLNIISIEKPKYYYIYAKKIFNFAFFSLIAGSLAACLLLPEIAAFKLSGSNDFDFPKELNNYFPVLEMLVRHLPNVEVHLGLEHYPNIFCGSFIFMLIPLYWFNDKQTMRNKVTKIILAIILLTSFNFNTPNFIWHGLHYPNSLPARQGFIYIFLLLTMCYEALINIKNYSKNQILGSFAFSICFLVFAEEAYCGGVYKFDSFYGAGFFLFLYLILILAHNYSKISRYIILTALIIVCGYETGMNMENTGLGTTGRTPYLSNFDEMRTLRTELENNDTGLYRSEIFYGYRSKNDTAWYNVKGISTFSSTANAGVTDFLDKMGCETSFNAYSSHGVTVLTSAMLDIKYMFSIMNRVECNDLSFYANVGSSYVYENTYTLPISFLVESSINSNWNFDYDNPFDIQNEFVYNNTGIDNLFYRIDCENQGDYTLVNPSKPCHAYIYLPIKDDSTNIDVVVSGFSLNYSDVVNMDIIDIGYITPEDNVYVTNAPYGMQVYTYDEKLWETAFNSLNESSLNVTKHTDTYIKGTVNAAYNGVMFSSIPYEKGWSVYVDGKKVKTFAIKKALLGYDITAGEHTVEYKYIPAGLIPGCLISAFGLIVLIIVVIFDKKNSKKENKENLSNNLA